jgi:hypothetical protein
VGPLSPVIRLSLLAACLALVVACQPAVVPGPTQTPLGPTVAPTVQPSPTSLAGGSPTPLRWTVHTSQVKSFSLQLPADWTIQAGIPAEDILLQMAGGTAGRGLISEDTPHRAETFQSYVERYYRRVLDDDPDAVDLLTHAGGMHVARAVIRTPGAVTVDYLFEPFRGTSKVLSFGWERPDPNPLWDLIAQRFNPNSPQLIIPYGTFPPAG